MTDVSTAGALLTFILIWLAIGVVASLVMGRRGHEPATWGVLGAALGPLVIPLAVDSIRREHAPAEGMVRSVESHLGPVDVLVGIDGSLDARQALQRVIELLGSRIGRLTLAAVLDFDTADSPVQWEDRRVSEQNLGEATTDAVALGAARVGQVVLAGRPADALERHAIEDGYDLVAIGCRGHGASKVAFGSVAVRLARSAEVPVFVVSAKPVMHTPGDEPRSL